MHKGASGQTGHYTTLYHEREGAWVLFDDEYVLVRVSDEEAHARLKQLAYICIYRSVRASGPDHQQQEQPK